MVCNVVAMDLELKPYIGIYAESNQLRFTKSDEAKFKKNAIQSNTIFGLQLNNYAAIEIGYEHSQRTKNDNISTAAGDIYLGEIVTEPNEVHTLELKSRAVHADLIGLYPVNTKINLLGSIGISWVNLTGYETVTVTGFGAMTSKMHSKTKGVLELGTGVMYQINPRFNIRGMVTWKNTAKLEDINGTMPRPDLVPLTDKKNIHAGIKNSIKISLGINFYPF
jgi:hypothetical protein